MTPTVLDYFSYYCELIVHFGLCIKINFKIKFKKAKIRVQNEQFSPYYFKFHWTPCINSKLIKIKF